MNLGLPFENPLVTESRKARTTVLSEMPSKKWSELGTAITERSFFSARVTIASVLDTANKGIDSILNPKPGDRFHPSSVPVLEGETVATLRTKLKLLLREISYRPELGKEGTIEDLRTDQRLNLIIKTNRDMALGYGYYMKGQDEESLYFYPVLELYRAQEVEKPRDWVDRWTEAATVAQDINNELFIALTDSDIWNQLGTLWDDSLGNPYPPFAFNSAMRTRRKDRTFAIEHGLISGKETPKAVSRNFNEQLQMSASEMDNDLKRSLMSALGPEWYADKDGIIRSLRNVKRNSQNPNGEPVACLESIDDAFRCVDIDAPKSLVLGQSVTIQNGVENYFVE